MMYSSAHRLRIFWMTMLNRESKNLKPNFALTKEEIQILDRLVQQKANDRGKNILSTYLNKIAHSESILIGPMIYPQGIKSYGKAYRDYQILNWDSYWGQKLWVINRTSGYLQIRAARSLSITEIALYGLLDSATISA